MKEKTITLRKFVLVIRFDIMGLNTGEDKGMRIYDILAITFSTGDNMRCVYFAMFFMSFSVVWFKS